jgi:hypothetical protein
MSESIFQVNTKIDTLAAQLEIKGQQASARATELASAAAPADATQDGFVTTCGNPPDSQVMATKLASELSVLQQQQEQAYRERAVLEERAATRQYLSPDDEQELIGLEDEIETLDAQVDPCPHPLRAARRNAVGQQGANTRQRVLAPCLFRVAL